ncbi:Membrane-anchored ubiquitin-fold protein 4 [Ancistrocladus abbreviatus]
MPEEEPVELKFRLYDGSDIGPLQFSPALTVAMVKERLVAECLRVRDKKITPKAANEIKLISAGKILENSKTVGQCGMPFDDLPRGIMTMHVVVQPSIAKARTEKKVDDPRERGICSCSILGEKSVLSSLSRLVQSLIIARMLTTNMILSTPFRVFLRSYWFKIEPPSCKCWALPNKSN